VSRSWSSTLADLTGAADTFTAFADTTPEELASRLHLSRFRLDAWPSPSEAPALARAP
jgi:hypothetical protein